MINAADAAEGSGVLTYRLGYRNGHRYVTEDVLDAVAERLKEWTVIKYYASVMSTYWYDQFLPELW